MTVHRVRLYHSTTGAGDFHAWIGQWLINMQPWADPEVTNELPEETTNREADSYYSGELAFEWSEDKAHILDNLDQYMASYCDWHRLGYHVCSHDEEPLTSCSWGEVRENGSVPSYIPEMN